MLHIEMVRSGGSTNLWKIKGLDEKTLSELNRMDYRDMKKKVLEIVDDREHDYWEKNLGTVWHNGYGVYNVYIMNKAVFLEIGKSCD